MLYSVTFDTFLFFMPNNYLFFLKICIQLFSNAADSKNRVRVSAEAGKISENEKTSQKSVGFGTLNLPKLIKNKQHLKV